MRQFFVSVLIVLVVLFSTQARADTKIFVASSLHDVAAALVEASGLEDVTIVSGASSSLARQIKSGAPSSLFISANRDWADYVASSMLPISVFSNRLVLISSKPVEFDDISQLPLALGTKRLAVADPAHVPAGAYAKQALEHSENWQALQNRLAPADNVRATARLVQTGAAPFGIVYASDAHLLKLDVAYKFSSDDHSPIKYWATELGQNELVIDEFMQFLGTAKAADIVAKFGFLPLKEY